jgi:hypothetical protein
MAFISGGVVNGVTANGGIVGPVIDFARPIQSALKSAGASDHEAINFASVISDSWTNWFLSYTIPGLPWYPSFAAFPAPFAPPTPNVPSPVSAGFSREVSRLLAPNLAANIRNKLGVRAMREQGADAFVNNFANWFGQSFQIWSGATMWMTVLGSGPVPTFRPPHVPVGPVLNGTFNSIPGSLRGPRFGI